MQRQKDSFFSLFYMSINIGSLLSTIITPAIRSNVFCFKDNCYALAFGVPAILMISSVFVFAVGWHWYTKVPAGENILGRMLGCIGTAIKGKCSPKKGKEKKEHWLDYAETKYGKQFVADMKDVTRVLWLFLPLPFFWALYDQQGSRWTLQAAQMNGDFGSFTMEPDMMQFVNSLLVVLFVPLMESIVFPLLDKFRIPNRPLQRMVWGMIFAASAFLIAAFLQISIDNAVPKPAGAGQSKVMFINSAPAPCDVTVQTLNGTNMDGIPVSALNSSEYVLLNSTDQTFRLTARGSNCGLGAGTTEATEYVNYVLNETKSYHVIFTGKQGSDRTLLFEQQKVTPTAKSASTVRVFNSLDYPINITLNPTKAQEEPSVFGEIASLAMSDHATIVYADFDVYLSTSGGSRTIPKAVISRNGAVYNILLSRNSTSVLSTTSLDDVVVSQLTDIGPRTVNIFLQIPQYVVITIGEVLFSVTGLSFAYSQSPASMKSLLQAAWLLTICFGNVIVIIVAEAQSSSSTALSQVAEFFLFAGLLYLFTIVFIIMSIFYKYVQPRDTSAASETVSTGTVTGETKTTGGVENGEEKPPSYRRYSGSNSDVDDNLKLEVMTVDSVDTSKHLSVASSSSSSNSSDAIGDDVERDGDEVDVSHF
jgi:hypothetical protein